MSLRREVKAKDTCLREGDVQGRLCPSVGVTSQGKRAPSGGPERPLLTFSGKVYEARVFGSCRYLALPDSPQVFLLPDLTCSDPSYLAGLKRLGLAWANTALTKPDRKGIDFMLYKPEACACPSLLLSAVCLKTCSLKAGKSKVVKMFGGAFLLLGGAATFVFVYFAVCRAWN